MTNLDLRRVLKSHFFRIDYSRLRLGPVFIFYFLFGKPPRRMFLYFVKKIVCVQIFRVMYMYEFKVDLYDS